MCATLASLVEETLEHSIACHGEGVVLTLLQALVKSHAVRTEATGHGLFVKILYGRRATHSASTRRRLVLNELLPISAERQINKGKSYGKRMYPPMPCTPPPDALTPDSVVLVEQDDWTFYAEEQKTTAAGVDQACQKLANNNSDFVHDDYDELAAMIKEDMCAYDRRWAELKLLQLGGIWMPLDNDIAIGTVVKTTKELQTLDKLRITLDVGSRGQVLQVDAEGDTLIRFYDIPEIGTSARWIDKADLGKLMKRHPRSDTPENHSGTIKKIFMDEFEAMAQRIEARMDVILEEHGHGPNKRCTED